MVIWKTFSRKQIQNENDLLFNVRQLLQKNHSTDFTWCRNPLKHNFGMQNEKKN